jgi:diguanylate cyclase (GGDEF)-like protein
MSSISTSYSGSDEVSSAVLESIPEPSFLLDENGLYVDAFGGLDSSRHHNPKLTIGKRISDFFAPDEARRLHNKVLQVLESGRPQSVEYSIDVDNVESFINQEGPQGRRYFEAFLSRVVAKEHPKLVLVTARCVTSYKLALLKLSEQKASLDRASQLDHLTGVYNRYALDKLLPMQLEVAKQKQQSMSAVMIDLDYFKNLNDKLGHLQGDEVLVRLGALLRNSFQPRGHCFRYGGDEFLVVLFGINQSQLSAILASFRQLLAEEAMVNPESPVSDYLTATIGVFHQPLVPDELTVEQLVYYADKALYGGKAKQKNNIYFL